MKKDKITGRPSTYNAELGAEICNKISCSSKGIRKLCKLNPNWPASKTIMKWRFMYPDFGTQYTRAKSNQIEVLVDKMLEIVNDESKDFYIDGNGKRCINHGNIHRARLKIDTYKWMAAKLYPKLYGDRVYHDADIVLKQEDIIKELE